MSITSKLKSLNLSDDAVINLSYSEGTDVFVHNETDVETALENTDVVQTLSELATIKGLDVTTAYGTGVLASLRDEGLLDDYERGTDGFSEYVAETIADNFYDVDLVDYSTEKYDYKRGFTTLSVDVNVPVSQVLEVNPSLSLWTVSVKTENGTLTLD